MGLHIGGLVIDRNFQSETKELEQILGKRIVFEQETTFKKASANDKEKDSIDLFFSDSGTLILMNVEQASTLFKAKGQQVVSFVIDEESMTFGVHYTRNGFLIRKIIEVEGEVVEGKGEQLDFEESEEDKIELIYHLIEEVLDEHLWDIKPDTVCMRYLLEDIDKESKQEKEIIIHPTIEFEDLEEFSTEKTTQQIINNQEEITKVKRPKKSIFKKVIRGLGLEETDFNMIKKRKGE